MGLNQMFWIFVLFSVVLGSDSKGKHNETTKYTPCSENINTIIDVTLGKYGQLFEEIPLPNSTVSGVSMISPKLTGLSSIFRSCNAVLYIDPLTKDIEVSLCLGVEEARLLTLLHVDVMFTTLKSFQMVTIENLSIELNVTIPLKKGGPVKLNKLAILSIEKVRIDGTGVIGGLDPIVNGLMKTKIKSAVINLINKKVPPIVDEILIQYPL